MFDPSVDDSQTTCYCGLATHLAVNSLEVNVYDYDRHFEEKFQRMKLQFPADLDNSNVLWNIDTMNPLCISSLPYLLILNIFNRSKKTFIIISNINEFHEQNTTIESFCEILSRFNIGSVIKLDEIYYTKDYQKGFLQLTQTMKIMEAIESTCEVTKQSIETYRASDLISIISMINNILYLNISHVLIGEHQASLYKYISSLLLNQYGKTLNILEIPTFPFDELLLNATKNQIHEQLSTFEPTRRSSIHHYLKAMIDTFYHEKSLSDTNIADTIDDFRRSILSPSSPSIYVAVSFLTDQFHVLKKHWKKNINKDDKHTGTGKGIDGLPANQKGFEPELGGKFSIIDWIKKEIVYTLDLDAPAGFFIEKNYLYIANNRLNYISIIDLLRRIEIKRIENPAFNCLHSLHRTENETLLVTSTGIDAIIQTDVNGQTLRDWYATEHGYARTPKGEQRTVERGLDHHQYNYPTLYQTTHINSAIVLDSDYYLATLFHQGLLVKINRTNGKSEVLLSGLNCPHAIKRYRSIEPNDIVWMLCNTKQNELLFLNDHFKITEKMILEDVNWLQDATQIHNENILITDANHSRIIEIDPRSNNVVSEFDYSEDWRIYQISDLTDFQTNFIPIEHQSRK